MMKFNTPYNQIKAAFFKAYGDDLQGMPTCLDGKLKYYKDPKANAQEWMSIIDEYLESIEGNPKASKISPEVHFTKSNLVILYRDLKHTEGWDKTLDDITTEWEQGIDEN